MCAGGNPTQPWGASVLRLTGVLGTLDVAQLMSAEEGGTSVAGVVPAGACIFANTGTRPCTRTTPEYLLSR